MSPVVGFDLDMTLIDSRPGVAATYRALTELTGVQVDAEVAVSRLGPPLRHEISQWFPADQVDAAVEQFRSLYPHYAVDPTLPMPGAVAALELVRKWGGRVVVVTSKLGRLARLHLDHLSLPVDEVAGDLFAEGKAAALHEYAVQLYVGDHTADMVAARTAGIPGLGVASGPCSAAELQSTGAAAVIDDLTGFPAAADALLRLAW
ncbi:HAD hydrolase-like protein [Solwaraspora sp. WMMA2080]|uniref:HAD family hydrolase n=1 Tax=unclassified Solwaraspora TaxID=2627926 RepID=UPI00248BD3B2|nr:MULTISPECIES: HAD hydrolase-like protein [unclassified Solwaraspora]WBB96493.1 HAD hydrolase-like protein [Solwaraspora sp. WMMA2059]WBC19601.1 HAD hydrolase-like protein [Solwaraspora sp. WMMA2080]